jgi:serine/threonine-protein kinase
LLTPEYAAPEQWRGTLASELDGRTDIYTLGGVLYEMLAGRSPFHALNMEGWMYQHLQGVPEPLGNLRPDLAREYPGLEEIVMRMLAREREDRFPSTQALLEALAFAPLPGAAELSFPRAPATVFEPLPAPVSEAALTASRRSGAEWSVSQVTPGRESVPVSSRLSGAQWGEPQVMPDREPVPIAPRSGLLKWTVAAAILAVAGVGIWFSAHLYSPKPATALPVFTPGPGTYAEPRTVAISDATPNAVIHFTVDGNAPTEASPVYFIPILSLPSGAVVRAMATSDGHKPSADVTGVYIWSAGAEPAANPVGGAAAGTNPATVPGSLSAQPNAQPGAGVYDQAKSAYDRKQYAQARTLFAQACDGHEMRACNYLGFLYAQGLGGAQNAEMARAVYQKACDQGTMSSCASLGSLYQDAGYNDYARKNFKKACDGGVAEACDLLRGVQ